MSAPVIGGVILMMCSSSSAAAALMMGGGDDKKVAPAAPVPPPPKPPVVVDVPQEFRTATNPWRIASKRVAMKNHNRGRLDSPQAWSAEANKVGNWYQMDNGKIADIVGVAIKGRKTGADGPVVLVVSSPPIINIAAEELEQHNNIIPPATAAILYK